MTAVTTTTNDNHVANNTTRRETEREREAGGWLHELHDDVHEQQADEDQREVDEQLLHVLGGMRSDVTLVLIHCDVVSRAVCATCDSYCFLHFLYLLPREVSSTKIGCLLECVCVLMSCAEDARRLKCIFFLLDMSFIPNSGGACTFFPAGIRQREDCQCPRQLRAAESF